MATVQGSNVPKRKTKYRPTSTSVYPFTSWTPMPTGTMKKKTVVTAMTTLTILPAMSVRVPTGAASTIWSEPRARSLHTDSPAKMVVRMTMKRKNSRAMTSATR